MYRMSSSPSKQTRTTDRTAAAESSVLPHSFQPDLYPFHKKPHPPPNAYTGIDSSPRNLLRIQPCIESNKMRLSSMGDSHELRLRHTLRASLLWLRARVGVVVLIFSGNVNPCSLYNIVPRLPSQNPHIINQSEGSGQTMRRNII